MSILVRGGHAPDAEGQVMFVTPASAGWRYVGFAAVRLRSGERREWRLVDREACVVLLGGACKLYVGDLGLDASDGRASPFDGPPHVMYVPAGTSFAALAFDGPVDLAVGSAPAIGGQVPQLLTPADAKLEIRGSGNMERRIHHLLMEDRRAERLLVTEVVTPAGHWSSYPPHKHDTDDPPRETALEETYYYRLRDAERGFAVQRVYTADGSLDETVAARDGDLVLVPRGFHTVSAPPGYEVYYLNVMAGSRREWKVTFDPDHERLRG
ncbi:MAG TPA: 5-deoxy-glucuronate isomerase [Candidatus Limnocylindria bacterium]|nr:5-deoxy-glucuronate isomerase [Candidatus Limnocylindria bacterium]